MSGIRHEISLATRHIIGIAVFLLLALLICGCLAEKSGDDGQVPSSKEAKFASVGINPPSVNVTSERFNVVLIVVDDLRADHIGAYGYGLDTTPFLSNLSSRGILYKNAYSCSSRTISASASMQTSRYPFEHGVETGGSIPIRTQGNDQQVRINDMPAEMSTLAEVLREAGYSTYGFSENPYLKPATGFGRGYVKFETLNSKLPNSSINDRMTELETEIRNSTPYFLFIHYMDVHGPSRLTEPWFTKYKQVEPAKIAAYDSAITSVDSKIKELYLKFGWDERTVVIFTSDHGEGFKEHGLPGHGNSLYQELVHVPLLVSIPGVNSTVIVEDDVSHLDVLPTIREVVGLPPDGGDRGISLLRPLRQKPQGGRLIISRLLRGEDEHNPGIDIGSIIRDKWKYIHTYRRGKTKEELYNLADDPREKYNLASIETEITRGLRREYLKAYDSAIKRQNASNVLQTEDVQRLISLGYLN